MDEITDPEITVEVEGLKKDGPKSYILSKRKDTLSYYQSTKFNTVSLLSCKNNIIFTQTKFCYGYFNQRIFHTRVRAASRIGPHNIDVISVLIGTLLGDAYANKRSIEGTRICYRQSIKHKDYLFWLYNFFNTRGYCSNLEPRMYKRVLKKGEESTIHYGYEFNTYTFRSFNWIHEIFYKKGKKYINPKIENYITPLALAILIMDDGGSAKPGVRIATNSFNLEEVELLVKILKNKFDLDITVQHLKSINKYSIYIKGGSIPTLRNIVLPHFHPSMYYKLGL